MSFDKAPIKFPNLKNTAVIKHWILGFCVATASVGCSSQLQEGFVPANSPQALQEIKKKEGAQFLAYEHRFSLELPEADIEQAFNQVINFCNRDEQHQCAVLSSSLDTGSSSYGSFQARVLPAGVRPLLEAASAFGSITKRSTEVEDLQDSIVDAGQRLDNLRQYQTRLREIEGRSDIDIESLIRVAREISEVQTSLEYAEGQKAKLLQRTQMDVVHITLRSAASRSVWEPVSRSLSQFGENLMAGISMGLTTVAYVLPITLMLFPFILLMRFVWRKFRISSKLTVRGA